MILIVVVLVVALSYVIDFLNPLTPDPPAILQTLQWRILVLSIAGIFALRLRSLILTRLHASTPAMKVPGYHGPPVIADASVIRDLTCSRLI
jgi:hypothetical protein